MKIKIAVFFIILALGIVAGCGSRDQNKTPAATINTTPTTVPGQGTGTPAPASDQSPLTFGVQLNTGVIPDLATPEVSVTVPETAINPDMDLSFDASVKVSGIKVPSWNLFS